ncbi:MAG: GNAT family N-acetyltransferase [Bacteroidota bacterium]
MIRLASAKDLEALMVLTGACAQHMISKGIFQWNEYYPPLSAFERDIEREELYVLEFDKTIQGCIVISTFKDAEYIPIQWLSKTEKNLYIHRLAIHPSLQGQGYAQKLMDYAESLARQQQFESIRLDTFSQNKRNQKFYEMRGYQRLGNIYFPKQSEHPFYCYELLL